MLEPKVAEAAHKEQTGLNKIFGVIMKAPWFAGIIDPLEEQQKFQEAVQQDIEEIYKEFAELAAAGFPDITVFEPIDAIAQEWIEQHTHELVKGATETTIKQLREQLSEAWAKNEDVPGIAKRIRAVFDEADRYRSFMIARTETTNTANQASLNTWKRLGVKKKVWITGADERVCPVCAPLHGKQVGIDEEFEPGIIAPSRHPNCRCTIAAVQTIVTPAP